ncbi:MAG: chorismate synthase [Syntrophales bacterium]|nr:chorismate synthase [Syntrophales bacterium]
MAGNTIGKLFRVTTWGESHGRAIGAVIDGCPPSITLTEEEIEEELRRRRPGEALSSPRKEEDRVEILSGVFEGKTLGTPISLLIWNRDAKSSDYSQLRDIYRPGHGDFTYEKKFGIRDYRGGGRASGRETAARVAAGVVASKVTARAGIKVVAFTRELGGIEVSAIDLTRVEEDPFFCPDVAASESMASCLEKARKEGDSIGGIVEIRVIGCPAGLGEPVFDKLDAEIAYALMSIGTVKGVEIGAGFQAARLKGSENNDPITPHGFLSNHAGGILAGISTGQEIVVRVAVKPIPSISQPQQTIDTHGRQRIVTIEGRHDVCAIPRIVPVCKAMVNIVIADHLLRHEALK